MYFLYIFSSHTRITLSFKEGIFPQPNLSKNADIYFLLFLAHLNISRGKLPKIADIFIFIFESPRYLERKIANVPAVEGIRVLFVSTLQACNKKHTFILCFFSLTIEAEIHLYCLFQDMQLNERNVSTV